MASSSRVSRSFAVKASYIAIEAFVAAASFAVNASYIAIVSFVAAASFVDLVPSIITKA